MTHYRILDKLKESGLKIIPIDIGFIVDVDLNHLNDLNDTSIYKNIFKKIRIIEGKIKTTQFVLEVASLDNFSKTYSFYFEGKSIKLSKNKIKFELINRELGKFYDKIIENQDYKFTLKYNLKEFEKNRTYKQQVEEIETRVRFLLSKIPRSSLKDQEFSLVITSSHRDYLIFPFVNLIINTQYGLINKHWHIFYTIYRLLRIFGLDITKLNIIKLKEIGEAIFDSKIVEMDYGFLEASFIHELSHKLISNFRKNIFSSYRLNKTYYDLFYLNKPYEQAIKERPYISHFTEGFYLKGKEFYERIGHPYDSCDELFCSLSSLLFLAKYEDEIIDRFYNKNKVEKISESIFKNFQNLYRSNAGFLELIDDISKFYNL